ncbi:hypothetical protein LFT45_17640 [Arthrobacter sp. FW305-BF8]|uniref:hypothetical protein n=1 Tax=Arthrobacter sp. FW305-BF8 TaxID=2879617 RepID=UPI001F16AED5|nr:hypothetical protein [Arthrobacter sp. FW305-BF8]UKA53522.1 hypothetical protein LFT45_17640 [Arthrobacter sp. FW305-BF8]
MDSMQRSSRAETLAVSAFWRWWSVAGAGLITAAVMSGVYGDLPEIIGAMVTAIHPGLNWETGPGARSRHRLCVSGGGDPRLRVLAERWRRAAPAPTGNWEFAAAREPQPGMATGTLEGLSQPVDLALARIALDWDERSALAELTVYHPAFTSMSTNDCRQAGRLLVDWLIGEDEVQRWVRAVNVARTDPRDSQPAAVVPEFFQVAASRNSDPRWTMREAKTSSGHRVVVCAQRPLRWIDHPLLDLHTAVRISFRRTGNDGLPDDGLPDGKALLGLLHLEKDLDAMLGSRGELVASETGNGLRILHYYSDSEDQNGRDSFDRFTRDRKEVQVAHTADPGWANVRKFI